MTLILECLRIIVQIYAFISAYADIFKALLGLTSLFLAIVIAILYWPRTARH